MLVLDLEKAWSAGKAKKMKKQFLQGLIRNWVKNWVRRRRGPTGRNIGAIVQRYEDSKSDLLNNMHFFRRLELLGRPHMRRKECRTEW